MNNAILPQLPPNVDFPPEIFDSGQVEIDRVEKLFLPVHKNSNGGFQTSLPPVIIQKNSAPSLRRKQVFIMCDVKKYEKIYQEIKKLTPEDANQIEMESSDKDVKNFYAMIESLILQKRQREVVQNESY